MDPVGSDIEAELSADLDVAFRRDKASARRSVFNITWDNETTAKEDAEVEKYEKRLQNEIKEWDSMWRKGLLELQNLRNATPSVDASILSPEERAALKPMDLQKIVRETVEFCRAAHLYLEDYAEVIETQECALDTCKEYLCMIKENKVEKKLLVDLNLNAAFSTKLRLD